MKNPRLGRGIFIVREETFSTKGGQFFPGKGNEAPIPGKMLFFEKMCLTHTGMLLYHNEVPVRAQSAMMQEIAQR